MTTPHFHVTAMAALQAESSHGGMTLYVDARKEADDPLSFAVLKFDPTSIRTLRRLVDIWAQFEVESISDRWPSAEFDVGAEREALDDAIVTVSEQGFSVKISLDSDEDIECHLIEFECLDEIISADGHSLNDTGYSRLGGALLFSYFGDTSFKAGLARVIPELAAAELALDMAEHIATLPTSTTAKPPARKRSARL